MAITLVSGEQSVLSVNRKFAPTTKRNLPKGILKLKRSGPVSSTANKSLKCAQYIDRKMSTKFISSYWSILMGLIAIGLVLVLASQQVSGANPVEPERRHTSSADTANSIGE